MSKFKDDSYASATEFSSFSRYTKEGRKKTATLQEIREREEKTRELEIFFMASKSNTLYLFWFFGIFFAVFCRFGHLCCLKL